MNLLYVKTKITKLEKNDLIEEDLRGYTHRPNEESAIRLVVVENRFERLSMPFNQQKTRNNNIDLNGCLYLYMRQTSRKSIRCECSRNISCVCWDHREEFWENGPTSMTTSRNACHSR